MWPAGGSLTPLLVFLNLAQSIIASPVELQRPNPAAFASAINFTGLQAIVDPNFHIDTFYGDDKIKGVHAYMNTVLAAQELAMLDYTGREDERDYQYEGYREVTIHVRGAPVSRIRRRFALWGLLSSIAALSKQPPFVSAAFPMFMSNRPVGTVSYRGPHTPPRAGEGPVNTSEPSEDEGDPGADSSLYTPVSYRKRDLPPVTNQTSAAAVKEREGELQVIPHWLDTVIFIRNFFLAAVGGITQAAANNKDDDLRSFIINLREFDAQIWVETPEEVPAFPMRYQDAINGLVELVTQAVKGNKFYEVGAHMFWRVGEVDTYMGRLWILTHQDPVT